MPRVERITAGISSRVKGQDYEGTEPSLELHATVLDGEDPDQAQYILQDMVNEAMLSWLMRIHQARGKKVTQIGRAHV